MTVNRRPTRATVEGRVYLDLQNLARRQHRPTDELQQLYALEGFLARLAASAYADRLILKGGALLAAYDARRPTRDIDVQAQSIPGGTDDIRNIVQQVAAVRLDDGLVLHADTATAETIRDEHPYSGVRVTLTAALATARLNLHVDVSIGDPIWPAPSMVDLPRLLGGTIRLKGYPLPMVYAEKITTALERGASNTRWRDFADLYLLTGRHAVRGADLNRALTEVASYRQVELRPLTEVLDGFAELAQARWVGWRRKQHLEDRLPAFFGEVLSSIASLADPLLDGANSDATWNPELRRWEPTTT